MKAARGSWGEMKLFMVSGMVKADDATGIFVPSRDSGYTVICQRCGEMLLKLVYSKLNRDASQRLQSYCCQR